MKFNDLVASLLSEENSEDSSLIKEPASPEINNLDPDRSYYAIEDTFGKLQKDLEKLNRRNSRYGIPLVTLKVLGEKITSGKNDSSTPFKIIEFRLDVPPLKLEGNWKFLARVDHEPIGNLIVRVPGTNYSGDLHSLFGTSKASVCDHCGAVRQRTSTFVVQNDQGEIKRVGRQCLKDYLPGGINSAKKIAEYAEYISQVLLGIIENAKASESGLERLSGGGSIKKYVPIKEVFNAALYVIDKLGYISNKAAYESNRYSDSGGLTSTAQIVKDYLSGDLFAKFKNADPRSRESGEMKKLQDLFENYDSEKYEEKTQNLLDWAPDYIESQLKLPNSPMRDYFNNLKVIIGGLQSPGSNGYLNIEKHAGYVVGLIPSFLRAQKEETQSKVEISTQESQYVGVVGYPIGSLKKTDIYKAKKAGVDLNITQFPFNGPINVEALYDTSSYDTGGSYGYYGPSVIYRTTFVDEKGNQYVTNAEGFSKGDKISIERAMVKDHKDYVSKKTGKVFKQTRLNRVNFIT
jgi:hypothetical protein